MNNPNLEMFSMSYLITEYTPITPFNVEIFNLPVKKKKQVFHITKQFFVFTNKMLRTEFCLDKLASKIACKNVFMLVNISKY